MFYIKILIVFPLLEDSYCLFIATLRFLLFSITSHKILIAFIVLCRVLCFLFYFYSCFIQLFYSFFIFFDIWFWIYWTAEAKCMFMFHGCGNVEHILEIWRRPTMCIHIDNVPSLDETGIYKERCIRTCRHYKLSIGFYNLIVKRRKI